MSAALIEALAEYTEARDGPSPFTTAIPGLVILRSEHPKPPMPLVHKPALCFVAQGAKRGIFGETHLDYRAGQALVVGIETPTRGWVSQATPRAPFLGMIVPLDFAMLHEVMSQIGLDVAAVDAGGVFVAAIDPELDACAVRLVRLLEKPHAVAAVAPLIMRELSFWLLTSPYGAKVAAMVVAANRMDGIGAAIHALRARFAEPIRTRELASVARMSTSTLHRQFKRVTSMSPLQYQKQLRLLEARHLMLVDAANAETAAFRVGYESQSQFSREYARMFGAPPRRDTTLLRQSEPAR